MILFFIIAEDQFIAVKNLLDIGKRSEAVFNLSYVTTLTDGRISDCSVQDSEKNGFPVLRCNTQIKVDKLTR